MMDKKLIRFLLSMGKVGCIGFGGGSILIPVIQSEVIEKQKLDTKEQYEKDVIVASITPGALPIEIAGSLGRRNFGLLGMLLGSVFMAFPGACATVLLLSAFSVIQAEVLELVEYMTIGVVAFIMLLLTRYIFSVQKKHWKEGKRQLIKALSVMLVVFVLVGSKNVYQLLGIQQDPVFSVSTVQMLALVFFFTFYTRGKYTRKHLLIAVVLGLVYLLGNREGQTIIPAYLLNLDKIFMIGFACYGFISSILQNQYKVEIDKNSLVKDLTVWVVLLLTAVTAVSCFYPDAILYVLRSGLSVLMSFGGGDAYLTIADGIFVESGMVTRQQFYGQLVSVVNILPGSILCKTLSGIGYFVGQNTGGSMTAGVVFAALGFLCSVAVSCGFFTIVYYLYDAFIRLNIFQIISKWISPVIAGLLINIMLSLCNQSVALSGSLEISKTAIAVSLLLGYFLDFTMAVRFKLNTMLILIINLIIAIGAYLMLA